MPKKNDPQSKPHYKGLTFKEGRFVDELAKQAVTNGEINRTKAALKTYDVKPISAPKIGSKLANRVDIRKAFLTEMESLGVSSKLSITTHKRAFLATKQQRDYETGELTETPDYNTQMRAVQEFNKIIGAYAPTTAQTQRLNLYADLTPQQLEAEESAIQDRVKSLEANTETNAPTEE